MYIMEVIKKLLTNMTWKKTLMYNKSCITKHGTMPITRNISFGNQNPKIQTLIYISAGLPRQNLPL